MHAPMSVTKIQQQPQWLQWITISNKYFFSVINNQPTKQQINYLYTTNFNIPNTQRHQQPTNNLQLTSYQMQEQINKILTLEQFKHQNQSQIIISSSYRMQLLSEANQLSKKGEVYESEGNYDYAAQCYKKIVVLLQGVIQLNVSDVVKVKQLKDKVVKYKSKLQSMQEKEKEKISKNSTKNVKISKLGFPTQQTLSDDQKNLIRNTMKMIKNSPQKHPNKNQGPKIPLKHHFSQQPKHSLSKKQTPQMNRNSLNPNQEYNNLNKNQILKEIQPQIKNLIVHSNTTFDDIVGMEDTKKLLEEAVIRPRKRPDLYSGIRAPPKGLLLYGPPGNGKTYICKALANQSGCTFIALSAAAVMNKFVGETEKMLRKVFDAASKLSPTIIFIDEIDSILTSRSQNQNEASRRLKTEFLVLLDGINSPKGGQILVIGATNLPKQLDLAAKRRFNKLIYIGMPEKQSRKQLLLKNLSQVDYTLSNKEIQSVVTKLEGYSASEITNVVKEVCMIPLREISTVQLETVKKSKIRTVNYKDFCQVLAETPPLLTKKDLEKYQAKM